MAGVDEHHQGGTEGGGAAEFRKVTWITFK
ncbi:MAG: hypothetical protein QOI87_2036 [Bradyrhizobium sp.]|jgi:hypothetical protein|nr:hypothetical protein [Bradyrhizobium sp.]